jgi:hypothetical protein
MKLKRFFAVLVMVIMTFGSFVFSETMKEDFCQSMWDLHKGPYVTYSKYSWYRTFYLKDDMTIRNRNHGKIGDWELRSVYIDMFFDINQDDIYEYSIAMGYVNNSSIQIGAGEEISTQNEIKCIMVRLYSLSE